MRGKARTLPGVFTSLKGTNPVRSPESRWAAPLFFPPGCQFPVALTPTGLARVLSVLSGAGRSQKLIWHSFGRAAAGSEAGAPVYEDRAPTAATSASDAGRGASVRCPRCNPPNSHSVAPDLLRPWAAMLAVSHGGPRAPPPPLSGGGDGMDCSCHGDALWRRSDLPCPAHRQHAPCRCGTPIDFIERHQEPPPPEAPFLPFR